MQSNSHKQNPRAWQRHKAIFKRGIALLLCALLLLGLVVSAFAASTTAIKLREGKNKGAEFTVSNMYPGDSVTKTYDVTVSHRNNVTVYFDIYLQPGYEILAEVLQVKVYLPTEDVVLYEGLMSDIQPVTYLLMAGEKSLQYEITAYLDTSVGSITALDTDGKRYMNQPLKADFNWYYMQEPSGGGGGGYWPWPQPTPDGAQTGDTFSAPLYITLGAVALCGVVFLLRKKRKEEKQHEQ